MRTLAFIILAFICFSCSDRNDVYDPNVKFSVTKHNVIQVDSLYTHEVVIQIKYFYGDFSIDGLILNADKVEIITDNEYSILKPYKNHQIKITGYCEAITVITIKYTTKNQDLRDIYNLLMSYSKNCELYTLELKK